jgi:hypothetical protein
LLATHQPVFVDATDPLEADNSLCTTESMFGLFHCTEYQKTLYAAQQLRGSAGGWWTSYIATLPADHHVPWGVCSSKNFDIFFSTKVWPVIKEQCSSEKKIP